MNNESIDYICPGLRIPSKGLVTITIMHEPDCKRPAGKPCTCTDLVKAKSPKQRAARRRASKTEGADSAKAAAIATE